MPKTVAMRNAVLNAILRATALQGAATVYMSLHSADPGEDGDQNELSGNNYGRAAISVAEASSPPGETSNDGAVTFPTPSADWTPATHFAVWSASSGGTAYYYGALGATVTGQSGVPVSFPLGNVDFTED